MPAKVKVKVLAGRNLPVMDRAGDTTDAFVEIKFGGVTHKTDVCRKSLNPHWNSTEWYRFEVDDSEVQDEPLQLRVMDHDTYSANDAIGKVVISLAPLLAREHGNTGGAVMAGWVPVYDTLHGIRGELNIIIKVELFSDFNKFRQSSCGVQFFHSTKVPMDYKVTAIHGFVDELIINDDPEYQWIDKIRTPRASNEARQVAFIKLCNQVQRKVGVKASELGANAVIGFSQSLDLEGETGVVARATGTAVTLTRHKRHAAHPPSHAHMRKYLEMLGLNDETDVNIYFQSHQDELCKLLDVMHPKASSNYLDDDASEEVQPSFELTRQASLRNYMENLSINRDAIYRSETSLQQWEEDEIELQKLLNPNLVVEETTNPLKRIKSLKRKLTLKRLPGLLSRRNEKLNDDAVSVRSNTSEASRMSLTDLKLDFLKLKKLKAPRLRLLSPESDSGNNMASVLARSILHAQTNLASIHETQDSVTSSTTMRRSSESDPVLTSEKREQTEAVTSLSSGSSEDKGLSSQKRTAKKHSSRIRKKSDSCVSTPSIQHLADQKLNLPGYNDYYGSISSALSAESSDIYTSSEEDDETSLQKSDNEKVDNIKEEDLNKPSHFNEEKIEKFEKIMKIKAKFMTKKKKKLPKSESMPSSPAENKIKDCFSKITKNKIIKSLSHLSLKTKANDEEINSSNSDMKSLSLGKETVLGSPFMSYADLINLVQNEPLPDQPMSSHSSPQKIDIFIGSESSSRASMSNPSLSRRMSLIKTGINEIPTSPLQNTGLVHTAMETILMDKVASLMIPSSTVPEDQTAESFFTKVNVKLEKIEGLQNDPSRKDDTILAVTQTSPPEESELENVDGESSYHPCSNKTPLLQHLHPIKANKIPKPSVLEPIPSLPELNSEATEVSDGTDCANVCVNKHAVCSSLSGRSEEINGVSPRDHELHFEGATAAPVNISNRRTSESDLSTTPKGASLPTNQSSGGGAILKPSMNANNLEMLEYPFLTMTEFPADFVVHLGGTVCARSVKLVDGGEAGSRSAWWAELRTELRAHARALRCSAVLGYTEQATICEDVCVLSASGTAAVINLDPSILSSVEEDKEIDEESEMLRRDSFGSDGVGKDCSLAHVPYSPASMPYRAELAACAICGRSRVPAVLVATIEPPLSLPYAGKSCLVSAAASRLRRAPAAAPEPAARDISDQLPFLEYELHRLLVAKLRMQGANALFGLRTTIAIGERTVVALAVGTAAYITALPVPREPTLKGEDSQVEIDDLRKALKEALAANRLRNGYDVITRKIKIDDFEEGSNPALDLCADKEACVLELDESEDQETARALASQPSATSLATTGRLQGEKLAKSPPLFFMQMWRGRCGTSAGGPGGAAARALAAARYKLRRINPCALAGLRFHVDLPEDGGAVDELQLSVSGVALPLESNNEEVFRLDDELSANGVTNGVVVTPLPGVAGTRDCRGICALRLLFVRESTAIREAGGLSGFMHNFLTEVMAVLRAHTAALGGNVLASCTLDELMLQDNPHKNQAQCLLSVGGDVIHVTY